MPAATPVRERQVSESRRVEYRAEEEKQIGPPPVDLQLMGFSRYVGGGAKAGQLAIGITHPSCRNTQKTPC
jgi:hypothetical protein